MPLLTVLILLLILLFCLGTLVLIMYDLSQVASPDSRFHCGAVGARVQNRTLEVIYKTPLLGLAFHNFFPLPGEFMPKKGEGIEILLVQKPDHSRVRLITLQTVDIFNRKTEISFHPKVKTFGRIRHSPPTIGSAGD